MNTMRFHQTLAICFCAIIIAGLFAFAFMSIGVYAAHSWEQVHKYEQAARIGEAEYAAQRTSDLVSMVQNTKPEMGCPVDELHKPLKKGKSKRLC